MRTNLLEQIGLTINQATIYEILLERGPLTASKINRWARIDRSLVYVVLNELIALSLVVRNDNTKVATFSALSPQALRTLTEEKEASAFAAKQAYEAIYYQLEQQFQIQAGQPGVRFLPGANGMKQCYQEINQSGCAEISLIRSRIEPPTALRTIISEQVEKQQSLGIAVRVINSTLDVDVTKYLDVDKKRNAERRIIAGEVFNNPAQIIMWGEKTAFTTYNEPMLTTIIEHADIATTLQSMFQVLWQKTLQETEQNKQFLLTQYK